MAFRIKISSEVESSAVTVCKINDKKYVIEFGSNNYFKCENCSNIMAEELKEFVDFNNVDNSIKNIEQYFKDEDGTCE